MWKLWNWLFGWHYVQMQTASGQLAMIRRVNATPAGERYVRGYMPFSREIIFIDRCTRFGWQITPLTWIEPASAYKPIKMTVVK